MIDEKKLIEDVWKHSNNITSEWETAGILNLINKQPKVGEWIPCSERLPKDSGDVIITTKSAIVGVGAFLTDAYGWVQWYSGGGIAVDVIAWMPLPEPYKENNYGI